LPAPRFIHKPALPLCTKKSAGKRPRHTPDGWPPAGERPFRTRPVFILQVFIFSFFRFSFCKGSQTLCTPFHFPVVFPALAESPAPAPANPAPAKQKRAAPLLQGTAL